jgi:hypothetical protein
MGDINASNNKLCKIRKLKRKIVFYAIVIIYGFLLLTIISIMVIRFLLDPEGETRWIFGRVIEHKRAIATYCMFLFTLIILEIRLIVYHVTLCRQYKKLTSVDD